MLETSNLVWR